jgi:Holliday junction resolvase RusA-like endonuclease
MSKIKYWEISNQHHLNNMFKIILNSLEKKNIIVNDKQVFYNNMVELFYNNFS